MFGITNVEADVSGGSVRIFDKPACNKVVQIMRNRAEGNRFVSRRLVNFPSLGEGGTEGYLRLRIRAREL